MADVTTLWSKTSDFSAAVADFPCVTEKSLWDSEADATNFYGLNGTYLNSDNSGTAVFTFADGKIATTDTSGVLVGMYAYLDGLTAGTNGNGYYEITAVDPNVSITVDGFADLSGVTGLDTDDTCSYYVGGVSDAFDGSTTLQAEFDAAGTDYANGVNNVDILCHASTATTLAATVDIDNITGSTTTRVRVIGTDADFVDDGTKTIIETSTALVNGLFEMASSYIQFKNFDFDGGGKDEVSAADYCVYNDSATTSSFILFDKCKFHGAKKKGLFQDHSLSIQWALFRCDAYLNGEEGVRIDGSNMGLVGCKSHHNDSYGFYWGESQAGGSIVNCESYRNLDSGYLVNNNGKYTLVKNNVAYLNTNDGFEAFDKFGTNTVNVNWVNNTSSTNTGYGYNLQDKAQTYLFFGNNHAYANTGNSGDTTHCTNVLDADWADFANGGNIDGDPLFTSVVDGFEDFRPLITSPLIDAGVGGTGDTIGALCATAGGGSGGGAVNLLTGLLG